MKTPGTRVLLSVLLLAAASVSTARADEAAKPAEPTRKPFLWRVDGDPTIYLFGTIRVPSEKVLVYSEGVRRAMALADCVITEVPAADAAAPQKWMALPEGKTLADALPKDVLDRLHAYVESRGLPADTFDRLRPWGVSLALQSLDFKT